MTSEAAGAIIGAMLALPSFVRVIDIEASSVADDD